MTDIKSRLRTSGITEVDDDGVLHPGSDLGSEAAAYIERLEAVLRLISDNPGAHPANLAQYARNTIKGGNDE